MTRHVVSSDQVIHLWANQSQDKARNGKSSVSFDGTVLYSYSAIIGRILTGADGQRVTLTSSDSWSITTSSHQSAARRAVTGHGQAFSVPFMGSSYSFDESGHGQNLASLVKTYQNGLATLRRQRDYYGFGCGHYAQSAIEYAQAFGLVVPSIDIGADEVALLAFRAERDARLNDPKAIAKRDSDREKRAAQKSAREQRYRIEALNAATQAIADWRNGGPGGYLPYDARTDAHGGAMIRIRGDNLETSLGASVPLSHAIRVFQRVALCKANGLSWHRNGETIRVGQFQVDEINPDGSFRAGCHRFNWAEVESAARIAGVIQTEESTHVQA